MLTSYLAMASLLLSVCCACAQVPSMLGTQGKAPQQQQSDANENDYLIQSGLQNAYALAAQLPDRDKLELNRG